MTKSSIGLSPELTQYIRSVSLREADILRRLREETASIPEARMQIAPEQGQFLALLLKLIEARRTIEVGVFTGYSSLWTALTLPEDGYILACDVSREWTDIARRYWQEAGVAQKIDLRLAPATQTLQVLLQQRQAGTFDFVFIDADKENYDLYYEYCLRLIRPGGLIVFDNMLYRGRLADENEDSPAINALRTMNKKLHTDDRVDISMLPMADGITIVRKH